MPEISLELKVSSQRGQGPCQRLPLDPRYHPKVAITSTHKDEEVRCIVLVFEVVLTVDTVIFRVWKHCFQYIRVYTEIETDSSAPDSSVSCPVSSSQHAS